jgi:hypothetical protein
MHSHVINMLLGTCRAMRVVHLHVAAQVVRATHELGYTQRKWCVPLTS